MKQQLSKSLLVALLLAGTMGSTALAAEANKKNQDVNTSTTSISEVQKSTEQVKNNEEEITNARLRAQLGSKSRFSFKSDFGFNGGSIEKPFSAVRPNYRAGASVESLSVLSGNVGMNFRLTAKDNINLGTGVTVIDPFHGNITDSVIDPRQKSYGTVIPRYQVSTPFVSWSRGYKAFGLQQVSSLSYSHYTDSDSADLGQMGALVYNQTVLGSLGTNLSGGMSFSTNFSFVNGDANAKYIPAMQAGKLMRDDFGFGIYPFAEYAFNDKYSFRTVFGYFSFTHYRDEFNNPSELKQNEPYQSMGFGISVTRDIYLYPNIQFVPKDIRADRTNVALSANLSLF